MTGTEATAGHDTALSAEANLIARPNAAWKDTVTVERRSSGERLDISIAEARALSADLLVAADRAEAVS